MTNTKRSLAILGFLFLGGFRLAAQECDRLRDATSSELVSYLNGVSDRRGAECTAFAIKKLGEYRYEAAVPVLAGLLDFRRPADVREKQGLYLHIQGIDEVYPAARALEEIGKGSLPAVLSVIKGDSSSTTSRENAVFVWMEIHKDESPKGVALLKLEGDKTEDATAKSHLRSARWLGVIRETRQSVKQQHRLGG